MDDLSGLKIQNLLQEHLEDMYAQSPPESVHALDIEALWMPNITFWSVWDEAELAGCGALKELDSEHAEIKSMRTATSFLRRGVASLMLEHIIREAKSRGYARLSLETGSMASFEPAQRLYRKFGFVECEPFGSYVKDPLSLFMTLE